MSDLPRQRLFTPGPINTSEAVRRAMLRDMGSRDPAFIKIVRGIRESLLKIAGASPPSSFAAIPMQGSGTFAVEAAIGSLIPSEGRLLVLTNGAYGRRMVAIARRLGIAVDSIDSPETEPHDPAAAASYLAKHPDVTHVATVHCETTTGLINPVAEIGAVVAKAGRQFIVDAMSSLGGIPVDAAGWHIDCLVSSANKCIEGVPGIAFAIARIASLEASRGHARSLSLDLLAQREELERSGQFRFTPPTHVVMALAAALDELEREGGVAARGARYRNLQQALLSGMREMGFRSVLRPELQSPVITAFHSPTDPRFDFGDFYRRLADRNLLIYPGKLSQIDSFRIGTIGRLTAEDITDLLAGIRAYLEAAPFALSPPE